MSEPIQLTIGEKTWQIGRFTQAVQSKFTAYLKGYALNALVKLKEQLGTEYQEALNQYVFDASHGRYDFYGKAWWQYIQENEHFIELLWLCIASQQQTPRSYVAKLVQEHPEEILAVWRQLLEEDQAKKA
jgi:hypothetical protein